MHSDEKELHITLHHSHHKNISFWLWCVTHDVHRYNLSTGQIL